MAEPLRHRQTKEAETDMPGLPPPRHIPTLPAVGLSWNFIVLEPSAAIAPAVSTTGGAAVK